MHQWHGLLWIPAEFNPGDALFWASHFVLALKPTAAANETAQWLLSGVKDPFGCVAKTSLVTE